MKQQEELEAFHRFEAANGNAVRESRAGGPAAGGR
jgi:hypothetical protein